jgi:hypothetical protein
MTSKVLSWLEEILPDIKRTGDPEGVMLKFAAANNLAPALLEKLAQVYNSAKTLNFIEKAANRGATFKVVDADALMRKYTAVDAVEKAAEVNEWIDRPTEKSAGLTVTIGDRWPTATATHPELSAPLENHLGAKRANAKAELRARSNAQTTEENYRQVVFDLSENINDQVTKIAERIRVLPDFDFTQLEADALGLHGVAVKEACDLLSSRLTRRHFRHKRASAGGPARLVRDQHGLVAAIAALQDAVELHKSAASLESEYIKASAAPATLERQTKATVPTLTENTDTKEEKAPAPASDGKAKDTKEKRPAEGDKSSAPPAQGSGAPAKPGPSLLAGAMNNIPAAPEPVTMMQNLVREALPTRNTGQQKVDRDFEDLQSQIVVERLLMTDPILTAADPQVVVSLANSIRTQAPHVARDINAMRFALREAVQYNALPTHSVKDLAGIEKTRVDTTGEQTSQDKDRYAQGFKKEKVK